MKEAFIKFVRDLQEPVRAQRQNKIREVELAWSADEFAAFRLFALGLHPSEMADVCHALSDAQAVPLLEILADFVEKDAGLMKIAFKSIARTSQQGRLFLARRLIKSEKSEIRAKTCEILGASGAGAQNMLLQALADTNPSVQLAAVEAITVGGFKSLAKDVLPLLRNEDGKVRFAALKAAAHFEKIPPGYDNDLLSILLDNQQSESARRLAALMLVHASNHKARSALLAALGDADAPEALRLAAAESLSAYNDMESVKAVMRSVDDNNANIAQMSLMSLSRNTSNAFTETLAKIIDNGDVGLAQLAAELLGGMDTGSAEQILLAKLKTERRMPVLRALAMAIANTSLPDAWNALAAKQKKENIDDAEFFAAMADAAKEENLDEFASFFDIAGNIESKRAILERLALFAQTSQVNHEMRSLASRILMGSDSSLHIFAADIMAHATDLDAQETALLMKSLANLQDNPQVSNVINALLRQKQGALTEIFLNAPPEAAAVLAYASREATCIGENSDLLFRKVASWARMEVAGSKEALASMASLAPDALAEAASGCPDEIFLIEAWSGLPKQQRDAFRPKFGKFFAESSPKDALTAINILKNIRDAHCLRYVADVAFTSSNPDVRKAASSFARELILTQ